MVRSMRWRLLAWYATVLTAVIGGFALLLYFQARRARLQQIDEQLAGAVEFLDATLRRLPPAEIDWERRPPFGLPAYSRSRLHLTEEQTNEIEYLDEEARTRLDEILTEAQKQKLDELRDRRGRPGTRRGEPPGLGARIPDDVGSIPPPPSYLRERVLADLRLPASLAPRGADRPEDRAFFVVWRPDGSPLKAVPESSESRPTAMPVVRDSDADELQFQQRGLVREVYRRGPHGTLVVVGKPVAREMNELAGFAWRLAGTSCLTLAIGLAGGWAISRGIVRPIARISATAEAISAKNLSGRIDTPRLDSELVGLAEVLNEMFSRLEAQFARQTRFTADASHELRTPVALLHSQIELALKRTRTAKEYRDALETCSRATSRMRSLLDGLLMLARADAGHLALAFQQVELCALVEDVAEQHRGDAERGQVTLSTTSPGDPVIVQGDPVFLSRVVANLLSNAIRHTPEGGLIQIALAVDLQEAVLTVADTGSGIPAEDQAKIFERFYRADKARSRASGGSGLGLAICKSIVEAHSGTIRFTSTPDRGTTFVVRIPIVG
jgi:two-component system, OmpR family, sensor kinase